MPAPDHAKGQSEAQYRAIFETASDGFILWDAHLRVIDANPAALRMHGYQRGQVIGRSAPERLPEAYVQERLQLVRRALAGETVLVQTQALRADGSAFDVDLRVMPFQHRGQPHALAVVRDISEQRERERALQRSEARLRATVEAAFDAVVGMDGDGRIVEFNAAAERCFGHRRDDVLGRLLADVLLPQRHQDAHARGLKHFHATGRGPMIGRLIETTARHADGREIPVELAISVAAVPEGSIFVGHLRDITDRRHADRALRDSEAQYRGIFNASADALVLRDAGFRIVDVNATYERMSGYTREDAVGQARVLANPPEVSDALAALHQRALAGEAVVLHTQLLRRDGRRYDLELRGVPILHRGEPHVLYIGRDVTEGRRAEQQRLELERQLRQAQKMEAIGQLTGGIAHDFNNILTSVIGWLALAQERADTAAGEALQRPLAQARLAAERARDLVAQMLAFARRQRGERQPLALAPLVLRTLGLLRATLPTTLTLQTQGLDGITSPTVDADPVQLEQVLFNLCINARDAMPDGGQLTVALSTVPLPKTDTDTDTDIDTVWHCASCRARVAGGAWARLAVGDTGAGVSPALLERIFDPFFSTKAPGRGSGMGLAMVHGIVHDHGGHLALHTAAGAGARFEVWLPLGTLPPASPLPDPAAPGARPPLRGHVLLVEDDGMVGDFLRERLTGWGLTVTWLSDPMAALALLQDHTQRWDLLLTDQTMPRLTGLQLAAVARKSRPALPIVLATGNAEAIEPAALASAGVDATLTKPLDDARLRALLQRWLAVPGQPHDTG